MIEFLNNVSPILLAFIATLFTYSVTAIGAALVFIFKKIMSWMPCSVLPLE